MIQPDDLTPGADLDEVLEVRKGPLEGTVAMRGEMELGDLVRVPFKNKPILYRVNFGTLDYAGAELPLPSGF